MAYLSHPAITLSLTPLGENTKLKYANTAQLEQITLNSSSLPIPSLSSSEIDFDIRTHLYEHQDKTLQKQHICAA